MGFSLPIMFQPFSMGSFLISSDACFKVEWWQPVANDDPYGVVFGYP